MKLDLGQFLASDFEGRIRLLNSIYNTKLWSLQLAEIWDAVIAELDKAGEAGSPSRRRLARELMALAPDSEAADRAYHSWIGDDEARAPPPAGAIVYLVISCEKYLPKALELYEQAAAGLDPAFIVLGGGASEEAVFHGRFLTVPAPDNYESLTWKVLESLVAVRRKFGPVGVVKIDDDSRFVTPPDHARIAELAASVDYAGDIVAGDPRFDRCWHVGKCEALKDEPYRKRFRGDWAGGPLYYLGPEAVEHLVRDYLFFPGEFEGEVFEDKMIGDTLRAHGVQMAKADLPAIFGLDIQPGASPSPLPSLEIEWEASPAAAAFDRDHWEAFFSRSEDPWEYGNPYEETKYRQTLEVLPDGPIGRALELGCAEGHFTAELASRVGHLIATDISATAVDRTRERCAGLENVECRVIDFAADELAPGQDLIVCSEALYYTRRDRLEALAAKFAAALAPGGHLMMAHAHLIADEPDHTGFDWGLDHEFGAATISKVFGEVPGLALVREVRTELYRIQLFRRIAAGEEPGAPRIVEAGISAELPERVARSVIWGGAEITRDQARARERTADIPILMYHSVADEGPGELAPYRVTPEAFRQQLRWLRRNGYHSITLQEWASCLAHRRRLPGRPVVITFDDGYRNFLTNAWPLLTATDFRATMFVVTRKVGAAVDWETTSAPPLELLSWDDLRLLRDQGLEIGGHSTRHANLLELSDDEIMEDCVEVRSTMRNELGLDVTSVAFPWGLHDQRVRRALARGGFRTAVRTEGGRSRLGDDPMNLPRIEIFGDDDIDTFGRRVQEGALGQAPRDQPGEPLQTVVGGARFAEAPPLTFRAQEEALMDSDYAHRLATRLGGLIDGLTAIRTELLMVGSMSTNIQRTLLGLFSIPLTGDDARRVEPYQELCDGVQLGFERSGAVELAVTPKLDQTLSPADCLNTLRLAFSGRSGWLTLEADMVWSELAAAQRYQLTVCAEPYRLVNCRADLRLPKKDGSFTDVTFSAFELQPGLKSANRSGEFSPPDMSEFDTSQRPKLLFFFDTERDLRLELNYINLYFA